jgi:hypothetical protein
MSDNNDQQGKLKEFSKKLTGKEVTIIGDHPKSGTRATIVGIDLTAIGPGIKLKNDEEEFFVFKSEHIQLDPGLTLFSDPPPPNPILDDSASILQKVEAFGKLKYSPESIVVIFGYTDFARECFMKKLADPDDELNKAYQRGLIMGDVEIDIALQQQAMNGDTFSASELSVRQHYHKVDEIRKELFNI